jgi:hypothetical protein
MVIELYLVGADVGEYSRTSISGTALSGGRPLSGRFSARSDSIHRHYVQGFAGLSCERELYALVFASR